MEKNKRFRVYGILTGPGEKTTVFTIYGSYGGSHSWEILEIDMKPILGKSKRKKLNLVFLKVFTENFVSFVKHQSKNK